MGTCFAAYFIGTLTVLITEGDKVKSYKLEKLEEAQHFVDHHRLPKELQRAILTHTRYHCNYNFVFDENEIISNLPLHLQLQINYYLSQHIIKQIDIFGSLNNDSLLGQIALKIRSISCNENHKLYHKGSRAKEIYIQRTGCSILNYHDNTKKNRILRRGNVFGELALISPKRKTTVTCQTFSEFYVLSISDIVDILQREYPKNYLKKWQKMVNTIKDNKSNKIRKVDFNKYRHDHDDMDQEDINNSDRNDNGLIAFLNGSTVRTVRTTRIGNSQTKLTTNTSNDDNKNGIFQSIRGLLKSNSDINKETEATIKTNAENNTDISEKTPNSGSTKPKSPLRTSSIKWKATFVPKRKDSFLRNHAIQSAHNKRKKRKKKKMRNNDDNSEEQVELSNILTKNKEVTSNSAYGHHEFYMQSVFDDAELESSDSDDDIGDIAPGLEILDMFTNEQKHNTNDMDENINKLNNIRMPSVQTLNNSQSDDLLLDFSGSKPRPKTPLTPSLGAVTSARTIKKVRSNHGARKMGLKGMRHKGNRNNTNRNRRNLNRNTPNGKLKQLELKRRSLSHMTAQQHITVTPSLPESRSADSIMPITPSPITPEDVDNINNGHNNDNNDKKEKDLIGKKKNNGLSDDIEDLVIRVLSNVPSNKEVNVSTEKLEIKLNDNNDDIMEDQNEDTFTASIETSNDQRGHMTDTIDISITK